MGVSSFFFKTVRNSLHRAWLPPVAALGASGGDKGGAPGFFIILGVGGCFVGTTGLCCCVFPEVVFLLRPPGVRLLFVGLLPCPTGGCLVRL